MDISEVLKLGSFQALQHIAEVTQDLLKKVREFKMMDEYENFRTHEQYQTALQKLESEVRNHIKVIVIQIEQQLKLYIESTQSKLEDSEKAREELTHNSKAMVEKLVRENRRLQEQVKDEMSGLSTEPTLSGRELKTHDRREDTQKYIQEIAVLRTKSAQDSQKIVELEKLMGKFESEMSRMRRSLDDKCRDYETVYKKYEELKRSMPLRDSTDSISNIEAHFKKKYNDKCDEVMKMERKLKTVKSNLTGTLDSSRRRTTQLSRDSSKSPKPNTSRSPNTRKSTKPDSSNLATTLTSRLSTRSYSVEKLKRVRTNSSQASGMLSTSRR